MSSEFDYRQIVFLNFVAYLPALLFFKGFFVYSVLAVITATIIFKFDPLVKRYISAVKGGLKHLLFIFFSGFIIAGIAYLLPDYEVLLFVAWTMMTVISHFRINEN